MQFWANIKRQNHSHGEFNPTLLTACLWTGIPGENPQRHGDRWTYGHRANAPLYFKEPIEVVQPLGTWLGCLLGTTLWRLSRYYKLGGDPRGVPELSGENIYLILPGNASESPRRSWKLLPWRRMYGIACCHRSTTVKGG